MIEFIWESEKKRKYLYKGNYMGVHELSLLPQCIVKKSVLIQRLNNAVRHERTTKWDSVETCLTYPLTGMQITYLPSVLSRRLVDRCKKAPFTKLMNSMPINDSIPRIMQSKPIGETELCP